MQVNCEMQWRNVSNTCTRIPSKGRMSQTVGIWNISYWQFPIKCGTVNVTKNPDNITYHAVFKYYKINDTDYSNPITKTYAGVSDPEDQGHCERSDGIASHERVLTIAVFNKNGLAVIGCEVKDGDTPENYATVYSNPNADSAAVDEIYDEVKKIANLTLIKVYHGPDCKTF
ncbi:hypothetical protein CHUAL_000192 [Chamberlinius hualienensis]